MGGGCAGGCCWQLRGRWGSLSALSNYVWRFHAGPLSKKLTIFTDKNIGVQTHKANTHPSLMIQSCDCRLPAMIEPLHRPRQHKSMSITSPEHIRHLPFLLIISMAHRHIPIPHQANSEATAHKQQSQKEGNEFSAHVQIQSSTLNCVHCVEWNACNSPAQALFAFTRTLGGTVINYRWPCYHRQHQRLREWAEANTHARMTLVCARWHIYTHVHLGAGKLMHAH